LTPLIGAYLRLLNEKEKKPHKRSSAKISGLFFSRSEGTHFITPPGQVDIYALSRFVRLCDSTELAEVRIYQARKEMKIEPQLGCPSLTLKMKAISRRSDQPMLGRSIF
jgi:hypothetical protein